MPTFKEIMDAINDPGMSAERARLAHEEMDRLWAKAHARDELAQQQPSWRVPIAPPASRQLYATNQDESDATDATYDFEPGAKLWFGKRSFSITGICEGAALSTTIVAGELSAATAGDTYVFLELRAQGNIYLACVDKNEVERVYAQLRQFMESAP